MFAKIIDWWCGNGDIKENQKSVGENLVLPRRNCLKSLLLIIKNAKKCQGLDINKTNNESWRWVDNCLR